ncbi:MAG TPA: hypothetical protein VGB45_13710 [Abditibacterium sp.]|jgi:hypothetical protein
MPRRKSSPSAAQSVIPTNFRLVSQAVDNQLVEVHLVAENAPPPPLVEIEIAVERVTWIARDFIESMGGEAPYDRFEARWPLLAETELTRILAWNVAHDESLDERGADRLPFALPEGLQWCETDLNGTTITQPSTFIEYSAVTTFYPTPTGLKCRIGNATLLLRVAQSGFLNKTDVGEGKEVEFEVCPLADLHQALNARNEQLGLPNLSAPPRPQQRIERREDNFPLHTGEEWTALIQAASDGKKLRHFSGNDDSGILRHQRPNTNFFTETVLLEEERNAGHGIELLQNAAAQLDIDDGLAWLYISHLLAPPMPLAQGAYAGGWVDLDDIARKTMGGYARNPKEAAARRAKVWRAIRYGARANIGGQRSVPYFDKSSGKEIPTQIYTSPWQIVSRQRVAQLPLFGENDEPPVRVELVASREWTALTTDISTAQYLPFGEVLGVLPANQAGGAWARVLGLAYINWSRRRIKEALVGEGLPPRGELLDAFPSKVAPFREILEGKDPRRALSYWQAAEILLCESQIIETDAVLYEPATRKSWQNLWLSESPTWKPGPLLKPVLEGLSSRRFPDKPRVLGKKSPPRPRRRNRDLPVPE